MVSETPSQMVIVVYEQRLPEYNARQRKRRTVRTVITDPARIRAIRNQEDQ